MLAAALECFAADGFRAVTMEQIAQRAGFSKGAIYSNFESKTELFVELQRSIADSHAGGVLDRLERIGAEGGDVFDLAAMNILELVSMPAAGRLSAEVDAEVGGSDDLRARLAEARVHQMASVSSRLEELMPLLGLTTTGPLDETVALLDSLVIGLSLEAVGVDDGPVVQPATIVALLQGLTGPRAPEA